MDWHCTADDDAGALKAAELEWPSVPGRTRNDFIVKFVPADDRGD